VKHVVATGIALALLASASATQAAPGDVVIKPDWLRKPNADDLVSLYPREAAKVGAIGKVRIRCTVSIKDVLEQCELISETPPGWGFGAAAMAMTRYFSWRPQTVNGVAVGDAPVVIPVEFGRWDDEYDAVVITAASSDTIDVTGRRLDAPIWSQAPTLAQVAAAFPQQDVGKIDFGYAILRCRVKLDGLLTNCRTFVNGPDDGAFKPAARKLADDFKLSVADYDPADLKGASVDIPIAFVAPGKPTPKLTSPQWVRTLDPAALAAVYPSKAAAAGISRGSGVVRCRATHDGRLADCQVVSEDPVGLGFGEAGLKAADGIAMNPWTLDGAPVDDAVIELPITLARPASHTSAGQ